MIYQPTCGDEDLLHLKVIKNLHEFKKVPGVIIINRLSDGMEVVQWKV